MGKHDDNAVSIGLSTAHTVLEDWGLAAPTAHVFPPLSAAACCVKEHCNSGARDKWHKWTVKTAKRLEGNW